MLLNVEPCHPLYNRTVDFAVFGVRTPKHSPNARIWILLESTGNEHHNGASLMFIHRIVLEIERERDICLDFF